MIEALKMMGQYVKQNSTGGMVDKIVDNPNSNGKYNTVLILVFTKDGEEIVFKNVEVEEFSLQNLSKYAYKYGNPRGGDLTPTSKLTEAIKTYKRIQRPLKKVCKKLKGDSETEKLIAAIYELLQNEDLSEQILEELEGVEYEDNAVLTLGYRPDKDADLLYVGDFDEFTQMLVDQYQKNFYYKYKKKSIGKDNICYVCSNDSKQTYGYVCTFPFLTYDKPGFISGGFDQKKTWRNYPVCPECAEILDLGRDYLTTNLTSRFCGIDYFIIPKTIFSADDDNREELFAILEELENHKKMSLNETTTDQLTKAQDDIFKEMSEYDNYVNFNLMFYREQNSAFRILLYIEDVLPSYLQDIFAAKEEVDEQEIFRQLKGKEGKLFNLNFKFNLISDFFYVSHGSGRDFTEDFLEITNNIFSGRKISYRLLINRFIEHIREKFRNDKSIKYDNLKAIMILKFLKKLDLLSKTGKEKGEVQMTEVKGNYKEKIEKFLNDHSDILDSNVKRLVFLEGVLAQKLLNIQRSDNDGRAPFRPRLNGLKIDEKIAKRLYPEIINKLEEYDKNYYKQLEELIAEYIVKSDFNLVSSNELSFYFTTGMNLADKFKFRKKEKEDEE